MAVFNCTCDSGKRWCSSAVAACACSMAAMLTEKLTKEEYSLLAKLLDSDGPAGKFWEAVQERNEELNPEEYSSGQESKEEIAEEDIG